MRHLGDAFILQVPFFEAHLLAAVSGLNGKTAAENREDAFGEDVFLQFRA